MSPAWSTNPRGSRDGQSSGSIPGDHRDPQIPGAPGMGTALGKGSIPRGSLGTSSGITGSIPRFHQQHPQGIIGSILRDHWEHSQGSSGTSLGITGNPKSFVGWAQLWTAGAPPGLTRSIPRDHQEHPWGSLGTPNPLWDGHNFGQWEHPQG